MRIIFTKLKMLTAFITAVFITASVYMKPLNFTNTGIAAIIIFQLLNMMETGRLKMMVNDNL